MRSRRKLDKCPRSGKLRHPDFYSAACHLKSLARANREAVDGLKCYECPACKDWHVGHRRR